MISRQLNDDQETLNKNISEIDIFLKECIPEDIVLQMGSILTGKFRILMEDLGYKFMLKPQHPNSENSNKKMIRKSDMVIIINYKRSSHMTELERYAKEQKITHESVYVLNL